MLQKSVDNPYVFIGGTACDLLLEEMGVSFRATKDLDMVLIIEALDSSFADLFWEFIEDGGYRHRNKSDDEFQFYRFSDPKDPEFPKMIELFSRKPNHINLPFDTRLTPIHIDESVVSLSAILLNDVYYDSLIKSKRTVKGLSVIEIETLILFKIKAWLDLIKRQETGERVDSRNIRKHRNDIFRLLASVVPSSRVETASEILADISDFITLVEQDKPDLKSLGFNTMTLNDFLALLKNVFLETSPG